MDFAVCSQEFEVGSDNSECLVDDILAVAFHIYDWVTGMPDFLRLLLICTLRQFSKKRSREYFNILAATNLVVH